MSAAALLPALSPIRIAVVEDDTDQLATLVEFLQIKGYAVWGCTSAEAFYRRFAVSPVDLVLLDIGLPGEDGLSVAQHLQSLKQLKVIIISARAGPDECQQSQALGVACHMLKPVVLDELHASIQAIAGRSNPPPMPTSWHLLLQAWQLRAPQGAAMRLTSHEFALMKCLMQAAGQTISTDLVARCLYGPRIPNGKDRLDVLLTRLRKKCLLQLNQVLPVKTVHQIGYVFTGTAQID